MAGLARPNIVTHMLEAAVVTARNAEYTGTPFSDTDGDGTYNSYLGGNRAGSNAPGIGINTGDYDPELRNWDGPPTRVARVNQASAHIGSGDDGQAGAYPVSGITTDPLRTARGVPPGGTEDFNDELGFQVVPTAPVADGSVIANGVINRTGQTLQVGEWAWGTISVA